MTIPPPKGPERDPGAAREGPGPCCSVCVRLPREETWTRENERPPAVDELEGGALLRRCRECGRHYHLLYEEDRDDLDLYETWSLTRLTPPQTLRSLSGAALEAYRAGYEASLARLRAELDHPLLAVRGEAAYDVAAHLLAGGRWGGLADLLRAAEDAVKARVLEVLLRDGDAASVPLGLVRPYLSSPSEAVRFRCAGLLATCFLARRDLPELAGLLAHDDEAVLRAALPLLANASRRLGPQGEATPAPSSGRTGPALDATPFFDRLARLRHHGRGEIRDGAFRALEDLARRRGPVDPLPLFLTDLSSANVDVRKNAALRVQRLAGDRADTVAAIPLLLPLLDVGETCLFALEALRELARVGNRLDEAVPALVSAALSPRLSHRAAIVFLLQHLVTKGCDLRPHLPELKALLAADDANLRRQAEGLFWLYREDLRP